MADSAAVVDRFPDAHVEISQRCDWDFLPDLNDGFELLPSDTVTLSNCTAATACGTVTLNTDTPWIPDNTNKAYTALERKQENNRLAQRRFRQRKKVAQS